MKKFILPVLGLISLALAITWMANLFNDRIEPALVTPNHTTSYDAIVAHTEQVPLTEKVPGTVTAKQATDISSRILARIESIKVRAGDRVKQGDLLVTLEQTDLRARQSQAEERINGIDARLLEADQQLRRLQELFSQGMIARVELDRAVANQSSIESDKAEAQRVVEEMQSTLNYSMIHAPIDGRIIDRYAEPGDTASPGTRILSLYNPLSLRVDAYVREELALALDVGDEVQIEIPALQRHQTGIVEELVPAANPGARSFQIKVSMTYAADLLPGMFARLIFVVGEHSRLLVPIDRIARVGKLDVVWVNQQGTILKRLIKTGRQHGTEIEVLSGLEDGDMILPVNRIP
jgi:RND family efflux transporter MFP subunit